MLFHSRFHFRRCLIPNSNCSPVEFLGRLRSSPRTTPEKRLPELSGPCTFWKDELANEHAKGRAFSGRSWGQRSSIATMSWERNRGEITKELVPLVPGSSETTT